MKKLELINLQGKTYSILRIYGGYVYLGNPYDVNNEVVKEGIIWEMQPFNKKMPNITNLYYSVTRFFKTDVFGKSEFKNKLSRMKLLLKKS